MADTAIESLYRDLEALGVETFTCPFQSFTALAAPPGWLALNPAKIATQAQEREILIHEAGHFATGAFYGPESTVQQRRRLEAIAGRWGYKRYFPLKTLLEALTPDCRQPWQLAERLGLPQGYVEELLRYYTEALGVDLTAALRRRAAGAAPDPEEPDAPDALDEPPCRTLPEGLYPPPDPEEQYAPDGPEAPDSQPLWAAPYPSAGPAGQIPPPAPPAAPQTLARLRQTPLPLGPGPLSEPQAQSLLELSRLLRLRQERRAAGGDPPANSANSGREAAPADGGEV